MSDMELNYDRDMRIDEDALDIECLEHSSLVLKYARHYRNLTEEMKHAQESVKTTRSELINVVNQDPMGTTGKAKPNAGDIEAYYRRDPEYQRLKQAAIELESEAQFAEMAYKEFAYGRRASLEGLIKLHGQQYFAGPSIPRDLSTERRERQQKQETSNKNISGKIKRKKKVS